MLLLIVNPASGGGRGGDALPAVRRELDRTGLQHRVAVTSSLEHARSLAKTAAVAGGSVAALGGDGLAGAVAGALAGSDGVLGVLPSGRGNDFARVLGIPLDPVAACSVLSSGDVMRLDLGHAGMGSFIGIASCGFDSDANRIANRAQWVHSSLVYAYGGLRALVRWKAANFDVLVDGEEISIRGYTVAVANSPAYGGGMLLAPDASLTDGVFDVVLIGDVPKLRFARDLRKVFKGSHVDLPDVRILRGREVEVQADRPFAMYADGEVIAQLPVKLSVEPGAVQVKVPAGGLPARGDGR